VLSELLADGHQWWRIARADWRNPLDPAYARRTGGRWNPPNSYPTLYLNEDQTTARTNMQLFAAMWPYEPEDLRPDTAPILVGALLPRQQRVADAHTPEGVTALGLASTYPFDGLGNIIGHAVCQPVGRTVFDAGLRGLRCRAARTPLGGGRELAWFPATSRSRARRGEVLTFAEWFWQ
jgi:hypothetical protein